MKGRTVIVAKWQFKTPNRESGTIWARPGRGRWMPIDEAGVPAAVRAWMGGHAVVNKPYDDKYLVRHSAHSHRARPGLSHQYVLTTWLDVKNPARNGTVFDTPTALPDWQLFRAVCNRDRRTTMAAKGWADEPIRISELNNLKDTDYARPCIADRTDWAEFIGMLKEAASAALAGEKYFATAWCRDAVRREAEIADGDGRATVPQYGVMVCPETRRLCWDFGRGRQRFYRSRYAPDVLAPHIDGRDGGVEHYRGMWRRRSSEIDPTAIASMKLRTAVLLAHINKLK